MVLDHEAEHPSRRAAITSISGKIGCAAQTLNEWAKKAEVDSGRKRTDDGHDGQAQGSRTREPRASAGERDPAQGVGVEPICKVLPIGSSTDHEHVARRVDPGKLSARARRDLELKPQIERVLGKNFEVHDARKVWRQMLREGFDVARCTVERLPARFASQGSAVDPVGRPVLEEESASGPLSAGRNAPQALAV